MSKKNKEQLCIKFLNQLSYKSISLNDIYGILDWLYEEELLNDEGEEFAEVFDDLFIEEEDDDED